MSKEEQKKNFEVRHHPQPVCEQTHIYRPLCLPLLLPLSSPVCVHCAPRRINVPVATGLRGTCMPVRCAGEGRTLNDIKKKSIASVILNVR